MHYAERQSDIPVSQNQSEVIDPFTQYVWYQPFPARGPPIDKHSHLVLVDGGYYAQGLQSHMQLTFGQSFATQQAGHYPFPALGSLVFKHAQLAEMILYNMCMKRLLDLLYNKLDIILFCPWITCIQKCTGCVQLITTSQTT
ncbi:MAG: hypothetical protein EZS28_017258 [Streblomastix strix]|uniref:Uncharacterized protein n=1 Tax=Streblomastix strix TaxID=222440 RepID=A0A5J4VX94_9EUKA|nr:MAG: hypothetical protein EZS28_017258 [Streblomastix strix]